MMIQSSQVNLRFATPDDAAAVLALVRELAEYEKAPQEVKTQPEDYRNGLASGLFRALVLDSPTEGIVGMALFFPYFSTWGGKTMYLEDFIVRESQRGKGYGKILFEAFMDLAKSEGAVKLKWQVLDWNEPAKNFYRKYPTRFISGWENGVINFEEI